MAPNAKKRIRDLASLIEPGAYFLVHSVLGGFCASQSDGPIRAYFYREADAHAAADFFNAKS